MKDSKFIQFMGLMYKRINDHQVLSTAGEMAYYLVLSIFPLIAFTISVISFTWLTQEKVLELLQTILNPSTYDVIKGEVFRNFSNANKVPLISFSMIGTIFSASGGIWAIMRSLNRAYEVEETRAYIRLSFICILITIMISTMMILALFVMVFGEVFGGYIIKHYGYSSVFNEFWQFVRYLAIEVIIFMIFLVLFYITPNIKLKFKETIPGALLVTIGWSIVSGGFSIYVNNFSNFSKTYGSLGAGMLLLVWLYWNSTLVLIGGELNAHIHEKYNLPRILRGKKLLKAAKNKT